METNKNSKITIIILSIIVGLLVLTIAGGITYYIIEKNTIKGNLDNAIHAIVMDNTNMKIRNKQEQISISKGSRVSIIEDDILNNKYLIKYEDKIGTISKDAISYYKYDNTSKYSLMLDVSQFNIVGNESAENPNRNFQNKEENPSFS